MAKIINLKRVRKNRTRDAARKVADENAVRFGRTTQEVKRDQAQVTKLTQHLDGHKRDS